ncbi:MAG: thioredoxin [Defluviitaleaceae bacterium]|nr:thioredoxin [Defluviitaleaceae bacterium]
MAKIITTAEFTAEVLESNVPVLVDFYADWCGPCKMLAPTLDELAADFEGRAKIVKINVDNDKPLAQEYGVRSIPALKFFKDGKVVEEHVGMLPKPDLAEKLNNIL